jgi:hypothetical protein
VVVIVVVNFGREDGVSGGMFIISVVVTISIQLQRL